MGARLAIGFQVWAQFTSWAELMAAGKVIEDAGFDSLWSNDHLLPLVGGPDGVIEDLDGPIFEGWTVLAGSDYSQARQHSDGDKPVASTTTARS